MHETKGVRREAGGINRQMECAACRPAPFARRPLPISRNVPLRVIHASRY
jgi:hypothetical protein